MTEASQCAPSCRIHQYSLNSNRLGVEDSSDNSFSLSNGDSDSACFTSQDACGLEAQMNNCCVGSVVRKENGKRAGSKLSSLLKSSNSSNDGESGWQSDKMKAIVALAVNGALCAYPADVGVEFTRNREWIYFDLVSKMSKSGSLKPFSDPSFPQQLSSLCDVNNAEMVKRFEQYVWKRPREIFDGPFHIFYDKIEPDDIKQGSLGDCYFLSALSSLAEWPDRVRKLFLSDELQVNGCYGVLFCIRGQFQNVIVDDAFPCHASIDGTPAFSRGHGCELWVMILEKAWAKRYGSYQQIESGMTSDCLSAFTGAPVKTLLACNSNLWDQVKLGEEMNWIMSAAGVHDEKLTASAGIVGSHAYSLLAVYELETLEGTVRLFKLRNPWGFGEWTGDWSDTSSKWTRELREQLGGVKAEDDGIFYMSLDDFKVYFRSVTICMYHDNFSLASLQQETRTGSIKCFKVDVKKDSRCYFTVHQNCERSSPSPYAHEYAVVSMVVGKAGEYCASKTTSGREVWIDIEAVPGTYYVWVTLFWENDKFIDDQSHWFGFSSYAEGISKVTRLESNQSFGLLSETYLDHARKHAVLESYEGLGEPNCFKAYVNLMEYSYMYYANKSDSTVTEDIEFIRLDGLELVPPHTGSTAQVVVQPQSESLVLLSPKTKEKREWEASTCTIINYSMTRLVHDAIKYGGVSWRTYAGKDVDLKVYNHMHQNGAVYHFKNSTLDLQWKETWSFEVTNLAIMGSSDLCVEINLGPGESKTLCLERTSRNEWKVGASISDLLIFKRQGVC